MKTKKNIQIALYFLIIIFILLILSFIIISQDIINLFPLIAILGLIFLILGIRLLFLTRKEKGKLKLFLVLTGVSAISTFVFSILHNLFYALAIIFEKISFIFEFFHVTAFFISIILAPILFIIGAIISLYCLKKKKLI